MLPINGIGYERNEELREPRRSIVKDEPTAQMMAYRPSGLLTENSSKSLNPIIVINSGVRRNAVDGRSVPDSLFQSLMISA